jgi:excisionase family DNA binding protein
MKPLPTTSVIQTGDSHYAEPLLTKQQLANRLQLSARSVDNWMKTGRIPYLKCGKAVRFRYSAVLEKLNTYRVG